MPFVGEAAMEGKKNIPCQWGKRSEQRACRLVLRFASALYGCLKCLYRPVVKPGKNSASPRIASTGAVMAEGFQVACWCRRLLQYSNEKISHN